MTARISRSAEDQFIAIITGRQQTATRSLRMTIIARVRHLSSKMRTTLRILSRLFWMMPVRMAIHRSPPSTRLAGLSRARNRRGAQDQLRSIGGDMVLDRDTLVASHSRSSMIRTVGVVVGLSVQPRSEALSLKSPTASGRTA